MSGSGQAALTMSGNFLGGPVRCSGVVERLSRTSASGREALPDVREW